MPANDAVSIGKVTTTTKVASFKKKSFDEGHKQGHANERVRRGTTVSGRKPIMYCSRKPYSNPRTGHQFSIGRVDSNYREFRPFDNAALALVRNGADGLRAAVERPMFQSFHFPGIKSFDVTSRAGGSTGAIEFRAKLGVPRHEPSNFSADSACSAGEPDHWHRPIFSSRRPLTTVRKSIEKASTLHFPEFNASNSCNRFQAHAATREHALRR